MVNPLEVCDALRWEGRLSRRLLVAHLSSLAGLFLQERHVGASQTSPRFGSDPFTSGVASGDPDATSVVLWTRLAPQPLEPGGGMSPEAVSVTWEVAEDDRFTRIVQSGSTRASALLGHSVHAEVDGLRPDRWYYYRFRAGGAVSPLGRTRTLPSPEAVPRQLRFAFASCQHFEQGHYTAYEQMARDDLDLVCFLGDYIYEGPGRENLVRRHAGPKLTTLEDYRIRYAQYRSDALLRAAHARFPWFVTWDDHEFENNYAAGISERANADPAAFLIHRGNAYRAYYEAMPLRRAAIPRGPDMRLYRKASYGRLAELLVLDTRQYRTDQPNGDISSDLNAAALNPGNSLLGPAQRAWLQAALTASPATWNILAQQVMMGLVDRTKGTPRLYSMDQWPGAAHERMELVRFMADRKVANPVVLTGDIHSNWANELRVDDRRPEQPVIATEFVGTSISSGGNGSDRPADLDALLAENPCVKFHNRERGYVRCTVTRTEWKSEYIVVDDVSRPGGKCSTRAGFVTPAGRPGVERA